MNLRYVTQDELRKRFDVLIRDIPDLETFMARGDNYELYEEDIETYDELKRLMFLIEKEDE